MRQPIEYHPRALLINSGGDVESNVLGYTIWHVERRLEIVVVVAMIAPREISLG